MKNFKYVFFMFVFFVFIKCNYWGCEFYVKMKGENNFLVKKSDERVEEKDFGECECFWKCWFYKVFG